MDDQKPNVLLIFGTLSLGGCGGHPMRPKLNLKDKDQMSTPNEYTNNFKSNLTCIFLSVRAKLKNHFALGCPVCTVSHGHMNISGLSVSTFLLQHVQVVYFVFFIM